MSTGDLSEKPSAGKLIIALAGRRIDPPDSEPHFPLTSVDRVTAELEHRITSEAGALVCSAACGADLLALEIAESAGVPYHIVIPFDVDEFRKRSVTDRPGLSWGPLFDRLVAQAAKAGRLWVDKLDPEADESFRTSNVRILELARSLAVPRLGEGFSSQLIAIVVWEGRSRGAGDITEHFKLAAEQEGFRIETVLTV